MAMPITEITLGIDVSKAELVIYDWGSEELTRIENQSDAIKTWLEALHGPVRIAIEPTSDYHLEVVAQLHAQDLAVYLVNPRLLAHYRKAVGERNKTDPADASLLARYLAHEATSLRPFKPQCARAQRLWALIKRRGVVAGTRQKIQQSFNNIGLSTKALMREVRALTACIDRHILALIRELGWMAEYHRCLTIPGIGPANAAALTAAFHRGAFAGSDAFISFIGLDIRVRESGNFKGKRKLSKCGESEIRRLLFCATQPARFYHRFDSYYLKQLDKGLSKIAAKVCLARKLARIAFALLDKKQSFEKQEIAYSQSP